MSLNSSKSKSEKKPTLSKKATARARDTGSMYYDPSQVTRGNCSLLAPLGKGGVGQRMGGGGGEEERGSRGLRI